MVKQPQERIILFSEQPNHKILHDNSSQQLPSRRGSLSGSRGRHGIDGQKRAKYAVPSRRGECCSLTAPLTAVIAAKQTAFVISGTVPARSSAARLHPALQPDGFRGDRSMRPPRSERVCTTVCPVVSRSNRTTCERHRFYVYRLDAYAVVPLSVNWEKCAGRGARCKCSKRKNDGGGKEAPLDHDVTLTFVSADLDAFFHLRVAAFFRFECIRLFIIRLGFWRRGSLMSVTM